MKINKVGFFYPILSTIACIFLCSYIWGSIELKYFNPYEIAGEYSSNNYSVHNDTVRYLIFIILPIFTFCLAFFIINKKNNSFNFNLKKILLVNDKIKIQHLPLKYPIFFLIISFIFFLGNDWDTYYLDIFEEGLPLSGANNYNFGGKPWDEIYINTGLFFDILNAKISWSITGYNSIGSYKFYIKVFNFISNISVIYFLFELSKQIPKEKLRSLFFLFIGTFVFFINLKNFNLFRDLPLILFLISILGFLNTKKNFYLIIIGLLSVFSVFWSLDRGFYLNLTLLSFLVYIFFAYKAQFYKALLFIIIAWIIGMLLLGINEFLFFLSHTREIFSQHEYLNGLIHPRPFTDDDDSTRATKTLILIIINFIITILIITNKKKYFLNNTKFLFIPFSILNFLIYKSALSRSDGPHIQQASYFTIMLFGFFLFYFILFYLNKKNVFTKKNMFIGYLLIFFFLTSMFINNIKLLNNIFKFPKNINNFVKADDKKFIDNTYKDLIKELNSLTFDTDCIQAFSYDHVIYYLMKKKSCSKFFNIWVIGSKNNQNIYISELKSNSPKYILTEGPIKFGNPSKRYPYIKEFIDNEYHLYKKIHSWNLLRKNR